MTKPIGNVLIAGDSIIAGIDEDDALSTEIEYAMVVQYQSMEDLRAALRDRSAHFTLFTPRGAEPDAK